eukprot:1160929-Pelagomonas_calceolata.AAC.1
MAESHAMSTPWLHQRSVDHVHTCANASCWPVLTADPWLPPPCSSCRAEAPRAAHPASNPLKQSLTCWPLLMADPWLPPPCNSCRAEAPRAAHPASNPLKPLHAGG